MISPDAGYINEPPRIAYIHKRSQEDLFMLIARLNEGARAIADRDIFCRAGRSRWNRSGPRTTEIDISSLRRNDLLLIEDRGKGGGRRFDTRNDTIGPGLAEPELTQFIRRNQQ